MGKYRLSSFPSQQKQSCVQGVLAQQSESHSSTAPPPAVAQEAAPIAVLAARA